MHENIPQTTDRPQRSCGVPRSVPVPRGAADTRHCKQGGQDPDARGEPGAGAASESYSPRAIHSRAEETTAERRPGGSVRPDPASERDNRQTRLLFYPPV